MEARVAEGGRSEAPRIAALRTRLLSKLLAQQARLAHLQGVGGGRGGGAAPGGSPLRGAFDARATDSLAAGAADPRADLDAAFSALTTLTAAITPSR